MVSGNCRHSRVRIVTSGIPGLREGLGDLFDGSRDGRRMEWRGKDRAQSFARGYEQRKRDHEFERCGQPYPISCAGLIAAQAECE